jgi:hypothetical protein
VHFLSQWNRFRLGSKNNKAAKQKETFPATMEGFFFYSPIKPPMASAGICHFPGDARFSPRMPSAAL